MIKDMGKDIIGGIVFIGGVAIAVAAAEASAPVIAGIGALTSLGAGVYEAVHNRSKKRPAKRDTYASSSACRVR